MTGVTTGDFKKFQLKYKLNIPANVILDVVQMVSVVATGCHGVGKDVKTPSDYVVKMRIIDAKGVLKTYKPENKEMFEAIQANFGCFGIIYDMTIKVIPQVIVKVENQYRKLEDVFYNKSIVKDLFEKNWSVEIFWFPFNSKRCGVTYEPKKDDLWVRVINKEENENVQTQQEDYYTVKEGKDFLSQEVLSFMSPAIAQYPSLTPLFAWSSFCTLQNFIYPATVTPLYQELPHAVHFRQFIDMAPVNDMEFAFDIDTNNYGRVLDIIQVVVKKVKEYETKYKYPLNIAMEMRMMGYSDALLCPGSIGNKAYKGHGRVLYIEVLSVVNTIGWEEFCKDVAVQWMLLDGVPHLAKQWDFIPDIEDHIYRHMGDQIDKFKEQLKKSNADPNGMFLNEKLKKLLRI